MDAPAAGLGMRRSAPAVAVSLVVHALLAIGFVLLWRSMVQDFSAREPISVEIVNHMPGEAGGKPDGGGPGSDGAKTPAKPEPKPRTEATPAPANPSPTPLAAALQQPAAAAPPPAAPAEQPQADTAQQPPTPTPVPPTPPSSVTPTPANPTEGPKPALIEPPPEPRRAAETPDKNDTPNAAEELRKDPDPPPAEPPPDAPHVLSVPDAAATVAPPAPRAPDTPKPGARADPQQRPSKDVTATLAAALPMSNDLALPSSFRAILSSGGRSDSQEYKGAVYGILGRIQQVGATAKRMGLSQGQVGLALTVAANGGIETISVLQSSGRPDIDAMVVDMVRHAGPFPAPRARQRADVHAHDLVWSGVSEGSSRHGVYAHQHGTTR